MMAIPTSWDEVNYPETFDFGNYTGGYDYKYYGSDGETQRHWYSLGTVSSFFDYGDYVDPDNISGQRESFDVGEVISFPNGYSLHLILYINYTASMSSSISFGYDSKLFDENGNEINKPSLSGVSFGTGGFGASPRGYLYGGLMPVACILNTRYYGQTPLNATHPTELGFKLLGFNGMSENMWRSGGLHMEALGSGANINTYDNITHYFSPALDRYIDQAFGEKAFVTITPAGMKNLDDWLHDRGNPYEGDAFKPRGGGGGGPAGSDDTSEPGGGDGSYDDTSDPIDFPDLPTGGALECGAVIAHRVSSQTIEAIFSKLWSNSIFDPSTMWQKSLQNPMDAIVSLHALPCSPTVDGSTNIEIGNFDTQLSAPEVTSQYLEIDCGTKNIGEYWGSALDYSPYTRAEIYLPFIGIKDIAVEDIMKATIHIKYYVDVLTGECIAFIKCGLSVLYHFKGNCKMAIPLSASTMDLIQNTLGAMGHITSSAAIGGAVGGGAGALAGTVMSAAANVASTKIRTSKSDDMSGSSALMDDFVPYFILHRPVQSLAKDYNKFKGYPSNITAQLSSLQGYTEVEHINLQNIPNATEAEMVEIKTLLKQGVLL